MVAASIKQAQFTITRHSIERVGDWLKREMRAQARSELVAAVFKILLSAVSMLVLFLFLMVAVHPFAAIFGTPVVVILALGVELGLRSRRLGVFQVHGIRLVYADGKGQLEDPGDDAKTFDKLALFPAWLLFSACGSIVAAVRLRTVNRVECAALLALLAAEDRRVFPHTIEEHFGPEVIPALRAMLLFAGVLVTSRDTPGLILTSDLGDRVRSML
jgi:hypothetical protein